MGSAMAAIIAFASYYFVRSHKFETDIVCILLLCGACISGAVFLWAGSFLALVYAFAFAVAAGAYWSVKRILAVLKQISCWE